MAIGWITNEWKAAGGLLVNRLLGSAVLLLLLAGAAQAVQAQTVSLLGDTLVSNQHGPVALAGQGLAETRARFMYLYTASELAGLPPGSRITGVAFLADTAQSELQPDNLLRLYLRNRADTLLPAPGATFFAQENRNAQLVFVDSNYTQPPNTDTLRWNLDSPFTYTGQSLQLNVAFRKGFSFAPQLQPSFLTRSAPGRALGLNNSRPADSLAFDSLNSGRQPHLLLFYQPPAANDLAVLEILTPPNRSCLQDTAELAVVIQNVGTAAAAPGQLTLEVAGPTPATLTRNRTTPLPPLALDTVRFSLAGPANTGPYSLLAYSQQPGDNQAANDTVSNSFAYSNIDTNLLPPTFTFCDAGTLATGNNTAQHLWSTGETTPLITFSASDTFWVQVSEPGGGCTQRDTVIATVKPSPQTSFRRDSIGLCDSVLLDPEVSGPPGPYAYAWSTGSGDSTIWVQGAGNYTVLVTDSSGRCGTSASIQVTFSGELPVEIGPDTLLLCGGQRVLRGAYPNTVYQWNGGVRSDTLLVDTPGVYTYLAQTISGTCSGRDTVVVLPDTGTMLQLGPPNLTGDTLVFCEEYTLGPLQDGFRYLWDDSSTNATRTLNQSGWVRLDVTDSLGGCPLSDSLYLLETPPVQVNLGADTVFFCDTATLLAQATPDTLNLRWSTGDTLEAVTVDQTGLFRVNVWNADSTCTDQDSVQALRIPAPQPMLGPDTLQVCDSSQLDAGPGALLHFWSTGATSQTILVGTTGTYAVVSTDPLTGCSGTDTIRLEYLSPPSLSIGPDTVSGCGRVFLTPNLPDSAYSFAWSTGDTTPELIVRNDTGEVSLTITDTTGTCTAADTVFVRVLPEPVFSLPTTPGLADTLLVCVSDTLGSGLDSLPHAWSTGDTTPRLPVARGQDSSGWLSLRLNDPRSGCAYTDSIYLELLKRPTTTLYAPPSYWVNEGFSVLADPPDPPTTTMLWLIGPGSTRDSLVGNGSWWLTFREVDTSWFYVILDNRGCRDTLVHGLRIDERPPDTSTSRPEALGGWRLGPNPTAGQLTLRRAHPLEQPALLELHNAQGRLLQRWTLPAGHHTQRLDLAEHPSGVYFLRLRQAAHTRSWRVLLQAP